MANKTKRTYILNFARNVLSFEISSKWIAGLVVRVIGDTNHNTRPRTLIQKLPDVFCSGALIYRRFRARRNVELYLAELNTALWKVRSIEVVGEKEWRPGCVAIHQLQVDEDDRSG